MREPPRSRDTEILTRQALLRAVLIGAILLMIVMAVVVAAGQYGLPEAEQRALGFALLVLGNLALILGNRGTGRSVLSSRPTQDPALWLIVGGTLLSLVAVMTVLVLQQVFRFALPPLPWLTAVGLIALGLLLVFLRAIGPKRKNPANHALP